jgi:hypothetical protein
VDRLLAPDFERREPHPWGGLIRNVPLTGGDAPATVGVLGGDGQRPVAVIYDPASSLRETELLGILDRQIVRRF